MDLQLKGYQTDAVKGILARLEGARDDWHGSRKRRTAFALSSTTGSGKTVIAATVIEALLRGSTEFGIERDPSAIILWVSKDPSLNKQTRRRFRRYLSDIASGDLVLLNKKFAEDSLQAGTVYFINPDKLRQGSDFVKHTDSRHFTFWEILKNTIDDPDKTLYMVLDEAHEGMKPITQSEQSIVQKIINGNGVNPPVPIVLGISATVKRFNDAMKSAEAFVKDTNVTVDAKDVQASGLLKNTLTLDIPDEKLNLGTALVREAAEDLAEVSLLWEDYCEREGANPVDPLLVIQIPNRESGESKTAKGIGQEDAIIKAVLDAVRAGWPDMPDGCVAHAMGRGLIEVGPYTIPNIDPEDVEDARWIRVLLAKESISTGWDCPRAEVLVSMRPAAKKEDTTHVTQLLGRMVRTPLAQETNVERLNSASCYLPYFDKEMAKIVAEELMGLREPLSGEPAPTVGNVMLKPVKLVRNPTVDGDVVELIESLPSYVKPLPTPRPIRRMLDAAQALAQDKIVDDATKLALESCYEVLDGVMADCADEINVTATEILTANVRRLLATRGEDEIADVTHTRAADRTTVDDALKQFRRLVGNGIAVGYLERVLSTEVAAAYSGGDPTSVDITAVRARVAALAFIDVDVKAQIEDVADALTRLWLTTKAPAIAGLSDLRRPVYERIEDAAREPELTTVEVKNEEIVDSVDRDKVLLPLTKLHVLSKPNGDYPLPDDVSKNDWERAVIAQESASSTLVGWYRNPSSVSKHSLRVVHRLGDAWKSTQPDFIFVHKVEGQLKASIVDPHGIQDSASGPRLKGLAQYADEHGSEFDRIVAVGVEASGALYGLDLKSSLVRAAVQSAHGDRASLDDVFAKHGKKYTSM